MHRRTELPPQGAPAWIPAARLAAACYPPCSRLLPAAPWNPTPSCPSHPPSLLTPPPNGLPQVCFFAHSAEELRRPPPRASLGLDAAALAAAAAADGGPAGPATPGAGLADAAQGAAPPPQQPQAVYSLLPPANMDWAAAQGGHGGGPHALPANAGAGGPVPLPASAPYYSRHLSLSALDASSLGGLLPAAAAAGSAHWLQGPAAPQILMTDGAPHPRQLQGAAPPAPAPSAADDAQQLLQLQHLFMQAEADRGVAVAAATVAATADAAARAQAAASDAAYRAAAYAQSLGLTLPLGGADAAGAWLQLAEGGADAGFGGGMGGGGSGMLWGPNGAGAALAAALTQAPPTVPMTITQLAQHMNPHHHHLQSLTHQQLAFTNAQAALLAASSPGSGGGATLSGQQLFWGPAGLEAPAPASAGWVVLGGPPQGM